MFLPRLSRPGRDFICSLGSLLPRQQRREWPRRLGRSSVTRSGWAGDGPSPCGAPNPLACCLPGQKSPLSRCPSPFLCCSGWARPYGGRDTGGPLGPCSAPMPTHAVLLASRPLPEHTQHAHDIHSHTVLDTPCTYRTQACTLLSRPLARRWPPCQSCPAAGPGRQARPPSHGTERGVPEGHAFLTVQQDRAGQTLNPHRQEDPL